MCRKVTASCENGDLFFPHCESVKYPKGWVSVSPFGVMLCIPEQCYKVSLSSSESHFKVIFHFVFPASLYSWKEKAF